MKRPRGDGERLVTDERRGAWRERRRLLASALLAIEDLDCHRPVGEVGAPHEVARFELLLPRRGSWAVRAGRRPDRPRRRPGTERRHRELAEAAKALLNRRLRAPLSLGDVARALAVSPFHLTRVFAAHTGLPLYRYSLRLRLLEAMERVLGGETVTDAATGLGFADHSHLTNRFRAEFGVPPSDLRRAPDLDGLRRQLASLPPGDPRD